MLHILAHEGVCAINNKTIAEFFSDTNLYASESKKSGETRITCFLSARYHPFPNDEKGNALMMEIAKKWMEQMGIRNTQYIIARHHETEHPHCHIVFNRIDNDGKSHF